MKEGKEQKIKLKKIKKEKCRISVRLDKVPLRIDYLV